MTEHLKGDGGESGTQHALVEAHTPSSIMSQLSTKHTELSGTEEKSEEVRAITGFKWILVVIAILSSHMLFALDNTIVANIQPAIVAQYNEAGRISWLSVGFTLCSSATVLPWSKVYATYNAKWLYIGCVILFMAGSALCGGAPNMNAMIIGRAMAGAGGSGMYFGVLTQLSVNTTVSERPFYIGLTAVSWGIGTVTGPAIGGAFAESAATWRWAFYINLVIGAVFAPVYILLLPSFEPLPNATSKEKAMNIDWVGSVLFIGALTTLIMGIDFGGVEWQWGNASASSGLFIAVYYIPLFFQFTQGDTAVKTSLRLLPFVLVLIFTIIANGHMMSRFGYYIPWYFFGALFELIAAVLMYHVKADTSASAIYGYTALMALGVGAYNQAGYSVVQAKVPKAEIPWALGFMMVSQLGGIVLALGMAGAIFVNKTTEELLQLLPDASPADVKNSITGTSSGFFKTLTESQQAAALDIIVSAIDDVYVLLIVAGALGVLLSLFLKREKLFMEAAAGGA
ncbi:Major facilitator superfamily domain general substrate transporter [Penicillium mononematosum]|uniref:Major facilitator superfamily domain general substrate transporter n=1 Tax=Penicillium mononematosum TaxID=268346 RepID=UPI002549BDE6|nr:Major facilitator superfamily domain general substrate transporter [Penicillium mononematosum]KAJ6184590.1 Major facilitator superfamily domain general substrate transporter [Penicillium mononematosum]